MIRKFRKTGIVGILFLSFFVGVFFFTSFGSINIASASCLEPVCGGHSCVGGYDTYEVCDDTGYNCSYLKSCRGHGPICYDPSPGTNDGCPGSVSGGNPGCTDSAALNYNPSADTEDYSCTYPPGTPPPPPPPGSPPSSPPPPPSGGSSCGNGHPESGEACDGGEGCSGSCTWLPSSCALPSDPYFGALNSYPDYLTNNNCYVSNYPADNTCIATTPTVLVAGEYRVQTTGHDELGVGQNSCNTSNTGGGSLGSIRVYGPGDPGDQDDDYFTQTCARRFDCSSYAPVNSAPTAPVIYGPGVGGVDGSYGYQFIATDPENNTVRYGVDWTHDVSGSQVPYASGDAFDNVADVWLPSSGYVADDSPGQTTNLTWATIGNKKFQALAQDSAGSNSAWTLKTVIISNVNTGPDSPTITGPAVGSPSLNYSFIFFSSDPQDDSIKYGISWDNDNTVDEWIPPFGYLSSGSPASATRSWPAVGTYTFKAKAVDNNNLSSGWSSHTITIGVSGPASSFTVNVTVPAPDGGKVRSSPFGIDCVGVCSADFEQNSSVALIPIPSSSYWKFNGWAGDCAGIGACVLIISSDKNVTASFIPRVFDYREF